jgi:hypothetical protein
MSTHTASRRTHGIAALALIALVMLTCTAFGVAPQLKLRRMVAEGTPRQVGQCMLQTGSSQGTCELGIFTGTYPESFDTVPALRRVRDAVRAVRKSGGRGGRPRVRRVPGRPRGLRRRRAHRGVGLRRARAGTAALTPAPPAPPGACAKLRGRLSHTAHPATWPVA